MGHTVVVERARRERLSHWYNTWMINLGPDLDRSERSLMRQTEIYKTTTTKARPQLAIQSNVNLKTNNKRRMAEWEEGEMTHSRSFEVRVGSHLLSGSLCTPWSANFQTSCGQQCQ